MKVINLASYRTDRGFTTWIRQSERNAVLEVDRLMGQPEVVGCTFGCTPTGAPLKGIEEQGEKWGE